MYILTRQLPQATCRATEVAATACRPSLHWSIDQSEVRYRVDCHDVLVLSTRVTISDATRNLGVVDRELSLAAHGMAVCRSGHS